MREYHLTNYDPLRRSGKERQWLGTAATERTQATECGTRRRTRRELEKETSEEVWEQKNDALRRLGLRTIPNPGE